MPVRIAMNLANPQPHNSSYFKPNRNAVPNWSCS